jgi:hypothetical protein
MATPSAARAAEREKPAPSGRLLLRMPAELHAELAQAAERDGTSLNSFITRALAARVGFGGEKPQGEPAQGHSRLVAAALVANAVVIGLAAVAAIAILVLAWQG